jgi:hypothetical protein
VLAVPAGNEAEMVNVEADWAAVLAAATAVARTTDPKPKQERRREKIARVAIVLNDWPKDTPQEIELANRNRCSITKDRISYRLNVEGKRGYYSYQRKLRMPLQCGRGIVFQLQAQSYLTP